MQRKQSSITAEGIAAVRAIESSKPPEQRICYDPMARRLVSPVFYLLAKVFAGYGEWRAPGAVEFIVARARYVDDYLKACLKNGTAQFVILGAGLDSRAYRFEQLMGSVKVFEVDHPATQKEKCRKLVRIFGELPKHVIFVPVDFNEEPLEKLYSFGYDKQRKTLFIWEGVTFYLTTEAVNRTLEFVARNSSGGSNIVFDYVYTSALTAAHKRGEIARMQRYGRFSGEPMTFGIKEGKVGEFLGRHGFIRVENVTGEDLRGAYFRGMNQNRPVAPIYAIVHAEVSSPEEGQMPPGP